MEDHETTGYVSGETPGAVNKFIIYCIRDDGRCMIAYKNLERLCEEHVPGRYSIEMIDIREESELADGKGILAVPTIERVFPQPIVRVIGDLSFSEKAVKAFGW